jgi:hypothetical protein
MVRVDRQEETERERNGEGRQTGRERDGEGRQTDRQRQRW